MKKINLLICFLPLLGYGQSSTPNIIDGYLGVTPIINIIANSSNGIVVPRDLDFHPNLANKDLWVVLKRTENTGGKTVKISNAGESNQTVLVQQDGNAWHFMSLPTGIAFGANGNFATSPGVFDANHNGGAPFTGPSLWPSDPAIYAQPSGGNGSHLDMLHESPYSMGIAYEKDNVYWVNDGFNNTVVRYDFADDHGPGNNSHSDGIIRQYTGLGLVEDPARHIPSHLVLDSITNYLYIVDTGNNRIIRLDISTGSFANNLSPHENVTEYSSYTGYTAVDYVTTGLVQASGIDIIEDRMIVSDFSNGEIIIFDISGPAGIELGRIQTGLPGVMGVKIGPEGKIWYVNATYNQVVRIDGQGLGLDEKITEKIDIYPNPAQNEINVVIENNVEISSLTVLNMLGQSIFTQSDINASKIQINTSDWSKGVYSVRINSGEKSLVKKIIIN